MFGKSNKPSPIDSLIGTGTTIEGDVSFTGGLRIDGHVKGDVRASGNKPGTLVISELAKVEGRFALPEGAVLKGAEVRVLAVPGGQVKLSRTINMS